MKRAIFFITSALSLFVLTQAAAQQSFSYYVKRTIRIDWLAENTPQRYTVAVNPFYLVNNGMKFDFEYELPEPGRWIQMSLTGYIAPPRDDRSYYWWWGYGDGNNRFTPNSSWDYYNKMWGIGASALYKHMWHRRGWYFSTGITLEFYRVGRIETGYIPYKEDGLTFYNTGEYTRMMSFVKPTAQFNVGKHMALSRRCFFDMFIGLSYSYSIYDTDKYFRNDNDHYTYYDWDYQGMYGFARRGFNVNMGFRFGVLLWNKS